MKNLPDLLKKRAAELGYSDIDVAKRIGIDARRYGHYVTGRSRPNYELLLKICDVLKTSPNELLGYACEGVNRKSDYLRSRWVFVGSMLNDENLEIAVVQMEALLDLQNNGSK